MFGDISSNRAGKSTALGLLAVSDFAAPEKSERALILRLVISGTVLVTVCLVTLIVILQPAATARGVAAMAFISSMGFVLLHINRRGRTRLAAILFAGSLIALLTALAVTAGGVRSPGVTMYFIVVLMTGLLLGERAGTITALVCATLGLGLLLAERADLIPAGIRYSSTTIWLLSCLYMGVTIILLRLPTLLIRTVRQAESELADRKQAEELLLEKQGLLQTMIENAPAAVAMFDTEMRYLAYSKRWLTDYRLPDRDLKGLTHYEVFPEIGEDWKAIHRKCLAGERDTSSRTPFARGDGTEDFIRWDVQPWFKGNGEIGGITMYTEVITARVRAEEEHRLLRDQLLEAQKFEALGTLAGGIAHDFNNILAMIGTNAELGLAEAEKADSVRASFREIVGATARAKDIVGQILLFSRKQDAAFETVLLGPIVEEALAFLHAAVPANVEIRKNLEADAPPVRANASQIYQILMNIGANAAHAMSAGGVLTVGLQSITIPSAKDAKSRDLRAGKFVRISIQDTGTGMTKETLNRIFEPFFTTKGPEGSGLGMSVVHGLIKDHGGAISVESEPGKGTTVQVYFPVTLAASADAHLNRQDPVRGKGQNIMYIDDEASLGRAMKRVLELLGYQCAFYADPQLALDAFRANPDQFDAVISDMTMPNLSGADIAREFSAIRPNLPIALTSGRIEQDSESPSRFEGVQAWISKPATIDEIGNALAVMLQDGPDSPGHGAAPGS